MPDSAIAAPRPGPGKPVVLGYYASWNTGLTQRDIRYGDFTIVLSDPSDRPANATTACGVNWLPFGPAPESVAIMRNMLPDPTFTNAIQFAGYGTEARDMGAYYPAGQYTTKGAFEARGCPLP